MADPGGLVAGDLARLDPGGAARGGHLRGADTARVHRPDRLRIVDDAAAPTVRRHPGRAGLGLLAPVCREGAAGAVLAAAPDRQVYPALRRKSVCMRPIERR